MTRETQTFIPVLLRPRPIKRPRRWIRWSARALVALGLLLLGYVASVAVQARLYDSDARLYVDNASTVTDRSDPHPSPRLLESALTEGEILGRLQISRLGISAAILQGTTSRTLRHGLGHIPHTALPGMPGNIAIAGHRDTFFRALKDIREGDEIELTTAEAPVLYVVDWARVVTPADNSVLHSDPSDGSALTLVTCYPFYFIGPAPDRYVVHAHKITTASPGPLPSDQPVGGTRPASVPGGMP